MCHLAPVGTSSRIATRFARARCVAVMGPLKLLALDETVLLAFYYEPRHARDAREGRRPSRAHQTRLPRKALDTDRSTRGVRTIGVHNAAAKRPRAAALRQGRDRGGRSRCARPCCTKSLQAAYPRRSLKEMVTAASSWVGCGEHEVDAHHQLDLLRHRADLERATTRS